MYRLKDSKSDNYFVRPSYFSWSFTKDKEKATAFETIEEANHMRDLVNQSVAHTYWDYEDIPPHAIVVS